jgi:hypothetical protein
MNEDISYYMAMTCVLPAATGIYKYKKIDKKYHPFILMMLLDVVVETIIYLSVKYPGLAMVSRLAVNLYMLLNFGLFLYFVHINSYLTKKTMQLLIIIAVLIGIFNSLYNGTLFTPFFYLLCFVCAVMLIISIDILSRQIMEIKFKLVNNFWFWVSSFSILYNSFTLLIFGLYVFAMSETPNGKAIGSIQHFVNVACYVFFAVAIFRIPEKNS